MSNKHTMILLSVIAALAAVAVVVSAGNPDTPPGPPETTSSYRLEDIYSRLDTGAAGAQITFTEPISGPTVGTGHTLDEIMAAAPQVDDTNGATITQVLAGTTYWGLRSSAWATQTGAMANNGAVTLMPTTTQQTIAAGYHDGSGYVTGDADLVAGNIRSGVTLFGVNGNPNVVNTSSGDAAAADILIGQVAWVDGSEVMGRRFLAPVPKTGQTISYATGDDGDLDMGVDWITSTRFITGTTGTTGVTVVVTDTLTGLVWLQDANCIQNQYPSFDSDNTAGDGAVTWQHALDFTTGITVTGPYSNCAAGFSDWRLPNVRELQSLIDYQEQNTALPDGHPFTNAYSGGYWSGTTNIHTTSSGWYVDLSYGQVRYISKSTPYYVVWPVRDGQ